MQEYVVNRPDEGAMNRILAAHAEDAAGAILRLAWQAGLLREEIQGLTWERVDFLDRKIVLRTGASPFPMSWRSGFRGCGTAGTGGRNTWCCPTGTGSP